MKGVEFTRIDGTRDYYDPVQVDEIEETDNGYYFYVGGQEYEVMKSIVKSIRYYDLCPKCEHELYDDGCRNCGYK